MILIVRQNISPIRRMNIPRMMKVRLFCFMLPFIFISCTNKHLFSVYFTGDYFRALERCLDCPGKDREQLLAQARRMADDFLQGKPDATPGEVAGFLGGPEELARCLLEELDPELLERRKRRRRLGRRILVGVAAAVIVALCISVAWLATHRYQIEVTERLVIYAEEELPSE